MARVKLTAGRVREFAVQPGKQQSFLWDAETPWLAVRATKGAKAFVFQSLVAGKTARITIGDVEAWDIDQARAEARKLQTQIDKGIDPRQAKAQREEDKRQAEADKKAKTIREAREQARQAITVGDAWDEYVKARTPRWSEHHLRDHLGLAATDTAPRRGGAGRTWPHRRPVAVALGRSERRHPGDMAIHRG